MCRKVRKNKTVNIQALMSVCNYASYVGVHGAAGAARNRIGEEQEPNFPSLVLQEWCMNKNIFQFPRYLFRPRSPGHLTSCQ